MAEFMHKLKKNKLIFPELANIRTSDAFFVSKTFFVQ